MYLFIYKPGSKRNQFTSVASILLEPFFFKTCESEFTIIVETRYLFIEIARRVVVKIFTQEISSCLAREEIKSGLK